MNTDANTSNTPVANDVTLASNEHNDIIVAFLFANLIMVRTLILALDLFQPLPLCGCLFDMVKINVDMFEIVSGSGLSLYLYADCVLLNNLQTASWIVTQMKNCLR